MCFAIPARILEVTPGVMPMARLDGGATCCLAYLPDAAAGDYVLVQRGFAVELLDAEAAQESFAAFASIGMHRPAGVSPNGAGGDLP